MSTLKVKFWGAAGSVPSPLDAKDVQTKIVDSLELYKDKTQNFKNRAQIEKWAENNLPFHLFGTYGGETTCVEIRCDSKIIVIDLGSGIKKFGQSIMPEIRKNKGIEIDFLMSHVHWDHIQGFPFFEPLFLPKVMYSCTFNFFGGVNWKLNLEKVLRDQMDPPRFPVEWNKVISEGPIVNFNEIHDRFSVNFGSIPRNCIKAYCRRLNHPNETYGWRIKYDGKVFCFASDTEPYRGNHAPLLELAKDADILYIDCQYTRTQYLGENGEYSRQGWGHGYDLWAAEVAKKAEAKKLILGHHDPASTDEQMEKLEETVKNHFKETIAAYDGLEIIL